MSNFQKKAHFDPHFSHILTLFSQRERKRSNFAEFNFADRAKIRENFFRKNWPKNTLVSFVFFRLIKHSSIFRQIKLTIIIWLLSMVVSV